MPSLVPIQNQITDSLANMALASPDELSTQAVLPQNETSAQTCLLTSDALQLTDANPRSSRKRPERGSPLPSPLKLTRSPPPKSLCRARTEREHKKVTIHRPKPPLVQITHSDCITPLSSRTINDFLMSDAENESVHRLNYELFSYMI